MIEGYICIYRNKQGQQRAGNKIYYTRKMAEFESRKNKTPLYKIAKVIID